MSMNPSKRHRKIAIGGQTIYSNANSQTSAPSGLGPTNLTIERRDEEGGNTPIRSHASPKESE